VSHDGRVKRPHLERRNPLRSWSTLFAPPPAGGSEDEAAGEDAGDDVVTRSVELGYRVIDDWMRQGQRAARRLGQGPYDPASFTQDVQDLTARIAQHASDLFGLWVELFEMAAAGGPRGGAPGVPVSGEPNGASPSAPIRAAAPAPAPLAVRIEVTSNIATEVALDLRPEAAGGHLVAHELRAADPEAPRLREVEITRDGEGGPFVARLRVPDDQPPGIYNGLILDEDTSRPVGTLSVRVGVPV